MEYAHAGVGIQNKAERLPAQILSVGRAAERGVMALYTAHADKNGEIWAGESHSGRYARFNPKSQQWTEYVLPEPYGFDRESWIDNSTTPVTVWYVDHDGWITRIEPME